MSVQETAIERPLSCVLGDFQYAIDAADDGFLRRGVLAVYAQATDEALVADDGAKLDSGQWLTLLELAPRDKRRALQLYSQHYLGTHGNVYWSDTMQLSTCVPTYADVLARVGGAGTGESLVIGELYVPPGAVLEFLDRSRRIPRAMGAEDIYGTIRSIRRDETSFLPWARSDFACIIFNLRTRHTRRGLAHTAAVFRRLNQIALDLDGSFFLTYQRAATRAQIERGYPGFRDFLRMKEFYDPGLRFQSEWWRWYAREFS